MSRVCCFRRNSLFQRKSHTPFTKLIRKIIIILRETVKYTTFLKIFIRLILGQSIQICDTKICPYCNAPTLIKNRFTSNRKQQFYCKTTMKRCIDFYTNKRCGNEIDKTIVVLIKEGMGIRSMARFLGISTATLIKHIVY